MPDPCQCGPSRRHVLTGVGKAALLTGMLAGSAGAYAAAPDATPQIPSAALKPFDLADVTLGEGPFLQAERKTSAYLLSLEPDRMLHNFRVNAGLPPKARVYGGWESDPVWADINCQGHTLGHYLSACALAYRSTRDRRFKA